MGRGLAAGITSFFPVPCGCVTYAYNDGVHRKPNLNGNSGFERLAFEFINNSGMVGCHPAFFGETAGFVEVALQLSTPPLAQSIQNE